MKKELKGIDENTVVHCHSENEFEQILDITNSDWFVSSWHLYESSTVYDPTTDTYSSLNKVDGDRYRVIDAKEFIRLNIESERVYTIQELRDGKVAADNDVTAEELEYFIAYVFPNDKTKASGDTRFYYAIPGNLGYWGADIETDLPTQSVKDFLPEIKGYKAENIHAFESGYLEVCETPNIPYRIGEYGFNLYTKKIARANTSNQLSIQEHWRKIVSATENLSLENVRVLNYPISVSEPVFTVGEDVEVAADTESGEWSKGIFRGRIEHDCPWVVTREFDSFPTGWKFCRKITKPEEVKTETKDAEIQELMAELSAKESIITECRIDIKNLKEENERLMKERDIFQKGFSAMQEAFEAMNTELLAR